MQFNPQILALVQLLVLIRVLIRVLELEYRNSIGGKFLHNPNRMHMRPFRCASNAAHWYLGVLDKLCMSRSTVTIVTVENIFWHYQSAIVEVI